MTPEQIKMFLAEREANRKLLAERIEQLDREIHDLRCRLVGIKPGGAVRRTATTNSIKLPPLPERFNYTNSSAHWCYSRYTMVRDDLGAYVRAEDYDALRNASEALRAEVDRLAEALRGWWEAHRPVGWTEDQHRSCPHVNLATDAEKALATALRERLGVKA